MKLTASKTALKNLTAASLFIKINQFDDDENELNLMTVTESCRTTAQRDSYISWRGCAKVLGRMGGSIRRALPLINFNVLDQLTSLKTMTQTYFSVGIMIIWII